MGGTAAWPGAGSRLRGLRARPPFSPRSERYHGEVITEHDGGSILASGADALVNPVNCVGVMGAGLAARFREAWPDYFYLYRQACLAGDIRIGEVNIWDTASDNPPKWIVSFPTKDHWRTNSRIQGIALGVISLRSAIVNGDMPGIGSIAVPALGCGLGGLDWDNVRPVITDGLGDIPGLHVMLYAPQG